METLLAVLMIGGVIYLICVSNENARLKGELNYLFKVTLANQLSLPTNIEELVQQAIYNDFYNNRVRINSTTYASRFYNAVNSIFDGIEIVSIEMASKPAGGSLSVYGNSVTCKLSEYPSLDTDNIQVLFQ